MAIEAVDEVGNPTILATLTVIAAILPMAFVGGLMGPYMRPIPIGASAAMVFSLLVAFIVTPWAAVRILKPRASRRARRARRSADTRLYRRVMGALLHHAPLRWGFLGGVVVLLLGSMSLVLFRVRQGEDAAVRQQERVPGDRRHARTARRSKRRRASPARSPRGAANSPRWSTCRPTSGTASPYNFNGLVRHYYLRRGSNVADIQVNLLAKDDRKLQSHEIAKQVRAAPAAHRRALRRAHQGGRGAARAAGAADAGGRGLRARSQTGASRIARRIRDLWKRTDGVVDVDWYVEDDQPKYRLIVDEEKAALNGISEDDIARTVQHGLGRASRPACCTSIPRRKMCPSTLRLDRAEPFRPRRVCRDLKVAGRDGSLVALGELVQVARAASRTRASITRT